MSIRIEIHKTVNKQVFFDAVEFRLKTILEKFNVVDVTGAGDVFISILVHMFLQNNYLILSSKKNFTLFLLQKFINVFI